MRELKETGIGWIGEIPLYWNLQKVKYNFSNNKKIVGVNSEEYQRLALTMNGVIKKSKIDNNGLQPDKFDTYQILRKDELVFKLIDLQNIKTSRVGLSPYEGIVSPAYIVLKSLKNILPSYAEKFFLTLWHYQVFNALGDNGVRSSLNASDLGEIHIPIPPFGEQKKIADFLDRKCDEIDALYKDIEEQISILKEYKNSIITESVTKGLNPNVEMKISGVECMPFIPKHWEAEKVKFHLKRVTIKNHSDSEVLSLYRDLGVVIKSSRDDNHNVTSQDKSKYLYVENGDLVINKMKAWQGSVAVSNYYGIVSPAYYVYKFQDELFNKRYFHYLIRNKCYIPEFRRLSSGIREGQWDLSENAFNNIIILIPPISEQNEIAKYLDAKCSKIDYIIEEKNRQLLTLDEYKKSLIYEYVTGKKEVKIYES